MAGEKEEDVDTLKRRGRRRLVGAVALVLLAVVVLPMVFDSEPRRGAPAVSVRVPGEDESPFTPKVIPKSPEPKPEEKKPEEKKAEEKKAEEKKAEEQKPAQPVEPAKPVEQAKPVEPPKPAAKKEDAAKTAQAERARAEAAIAGEQYVVPVGAFTHPEPVIAKLVQAKVKYYTEKVATAKGAVTRVRAGPFATKAEAEHAASALKSLGLKPGSVTTRS